MIRIVLVGNPNVGKSVVFSRLTGVHVIASNYPGTTVSYTQGQMTLGAEKAVVIDAPGVYGLEATCRGEEIALEMLRDADAIVNVVDATNLERNLHLTLHLLEQDRPMLLALNIWDDAQHKGIRIDVEKLSALLGVPVVPTVAVTGEGIRELVSRIPEVAFQAPAHVSRAKRTEEERWTEVGRIVDAVQVLQHRHHTFLEIIGDASVRPATGLPIAALILFASFAVIRLIGEGMIRLLFDPAFNSLWKPVLHRIDALVPSQSFLHDMLIGSLINGEIDFVQSFGLLSTGLYVAIVMVFPYVLSFYLVLGFLEDFGYLPRLAVLLDTLMHRLGLHGWAVIPMLLGFGCNVPGIMATRMLESQRERLIAATLVSVAVPCASLQAMMWGILGHHGVRYIAAVYGILFVVWIVIGRILDRILKGGSPELILEIPPYRFPTVQTILHKLRLRLSEYFKEAVPFVLLGVLFVNVMHYLGVFDAIADASAPVITRAFGLPKEAVLALVIGFLRKDVAVGMLSVLDLSSKQMIISVTMLCMSFPCVATFIVLARELGLKGLGKSVAIMVASSFAVGILLNLLL